jgi:hypothetical protein
MSFRDKRWLDRGDARELRFPVALLKHGLNLFHDDFGLERM